MDGEGAMTAPSGFRSGAGARDGLEDRLLDDGGSPCGGPDEVPPAPPPAHPARLGSFSPRSLLVSLCAYGFAVYGDRGVIASNGVNGQRADAGSGDPGWGIVGRFSLSATQDGFIPAALVVGVMFSVVASALLSRRVASTRLLSFGAASLAAGWAVCAAAPAFWALLVGRLLVGAGAGPFVALATPLIEDAAPVASTTAWIASVFVAMTTGYAAGFVYGGLLSGLVGWRAVFVGQTAIGGALAAWLASHRPATLKAVEAARSPAGATGAARAQAAPIALGAQAAATAVEDRATAAEAGAQAVATAATATPATAALSAVPPPATQPPPPSIAPPPTPPPPPSAGSSLLRDLARLASCRDLVVVALSLSVYVGALGAFAFYGPEAGRSVLGLTPSGADSLFGGISLFTGVVGTLGGGVLLDLLGARPRSATTLCAAGCFVAALGAYAAFSTGRLGLGLTAERGPAGAIGGGWEGARWRGMEMLGRVAPAGDAWGAEATGAIRAGAVGVGTGGSPSTAPFGVLPLPSRTPLFPSSRAPNATSPSLSLASPFASLFSPRLTTPPAPAPARSPLVFTLLLVPGLLALFSVGAPSQRALLWASPPHLRPLALAAAEISQHVFGDLPLPPLLGAAQDRWNSWPLTMGLAALASAIAGAGFLLAGRWAGREEDAAEGHEPGAWIERGGEPLAREVAEIDGAELEGGLQRGQGE